jgi:hypothetical protein
LGAGGCMAPNAGEAILQTDVVALESAFAATSTSMYVQGPLGYLRPLASGGFGSIVPAGCGDFWCSPEVLATVRERSDDEVTIIRGPVEVAGSGYQAIRFEVEHEGLKYSMTYDENTGLLLHHRYDILSADGVTIETGIIDFRNIRQVEVPWTGGSAPTWLRSGQTMTYQGQTVYTIPAYTASGVHQHMGFWLPQTALEIDEVGDVDEDPETGIAITVIQNDQNGIVFEETNGRDYQRVLNYDKATGKLLESRKEQLT